MQTQAKCENVKTEWLIEQHIVGRGRVRLLVFPVGKMYIWLGVISVCVAVNVALREETSREGPRRGGAALVEQKLPLAVEWAVHL